MLTGGSCSLGELGLLNTVETGIDNILSNLCLIEKWSIFRAIHVVNYLMINQSYPCQPIEHNIVISIAPQAVFML